MWNTEKILQRCIANFLQWVQLDQSSDKLIQSVYLSVQMTSSWSRASIDRQEEGVLDTCHHYIWKSQARKVILLDREERSRRRMPKIIPKICSTSKYDIFFQIEGGCMSIYQRRVTKLKLIICLYHFFNVHIMHHWILMFIGSISAIEKSDKAKTDSLRLSCLQCWQHASSALGSIGSVSSVERVTRLKLIICL